MIVSLACCMFSARRAKNPGACSVNHRALFLPPGVLNFPACFSVLRHLCARYRHLRWQAPSCPSKSTQLRT